MMDCVFSTIFAEGITRLFICPILFLFLATQRGMRDLSSPTRDRTHVPCSRSSESQPLDCQGSPYLPYSYVDLNSLWNTTQGKVDFFKKTRFSLSTRICCFWKACAGELWELSIPVVCQPAGPAVGLTFSDAQSVQTEADFLFPSAIWVFTIPIS